MGKSPAPNFAGELVQLILRAAGANALMQSDQDWRELGIIASRMLFWRGGAIRACRCDANEMRFAVQVGHVSLGSIAHHISGAYAIYLRRKRRGSGAIFKHYLALPCNPDYLDQLVVWLHRQSPEGHARIWTTEDAYLTLGSLPWVTTGSPFPAAYLQRKSEPIAPEAIKMFTRGWHRPHSLAATQALAPEPIDPLHATLPHRPSITSIAHLAAELCKVTYEELLSPTRNSAANKARVIAAVLATRNGATAAAAASLLNRSRSSLFEQVEYYRVHQPQIFEQAEAVLESLSVPNVRE
jgi:hypothetical protein